MLLRPTIIVPAVSEVSLELLKRHGVRAVMVDLDDTLVASKAETLDARFIAWAASLREAGVPLMMLSNGTNVRVAKYSALLDIPGIAMVGKPSLRAFRRGLELLGTPAKETAMVGDQMFTDVLGANLIGMTSILVTPLSEGKLPHTRLLRKLERYLLNRYAIRKGDPRGRSLHR